MNQWSSFAQGIFIKIHDCSALGCMTSLLQNSKCLYCLLEYECFPKALFLFSNGKYWWTNNYHLYSFLITCLYCLSEHESFPRVLFHCGIFRENINEHMIIICMTFFVIQNYLALELMTSQSNKTRCSCCLLKHECFPGVVFYYQFE